MRNFFRVAVLAALFALSVVDAKAPTQTGPEKISAKRWGLYAEQVGRDWKLVANGEVIGGKLRYRWTKPNDEFVVDFVDVDGKATLLETYRWSDSEQRIDATYGNGDSGVYFAQPDGSLHSPEPGTTRIVVRRLDDGSIQTSMEDKVNGTWRFTKEMVRFIDASPGNVAREKERLLAAKSVPAPLQDNGAKAAAHVDPVWGPLADLAGTAWAIHGGGFAMTSQFAWIEPGKKLRHTSGISGLPTTEIVFHPGRKPGELLGDITAFGDTHRNIPFHFDNEGVLVSDWYRRSGLSMREELRLTADGKFEERTAQGEGMEHPEFPPLHGKFQLVTAGALAQMSAESTSNIAEIKRKAELERLERERREKQASYDRWNRALGAAYNGLQAANEVATEHLAESQAELDATLEQAARQAAYERQKQAQASNDRAAEDYTSQAQASREATERQYEVSRQFEAQQAQREAALRVEERQQSSVQASSVGNTTSTNQIQPGASGPRMGFPGPTCEKARLGAQQWVGSDGTFEVESETTGQDGWCHIVIKDWHSGSGTASSQ